MAEKKQFSEMFKPTANGWDPRILFGANQRAFDSWIRGMSAFTEEMGNFMHTRLQEDIGVWTKLTSCKDAGQAFECQRQYVEKAAADYFDEAGKLSRLTMNLATEGFSALQSEASAPAKRAETV